MDIEISDIRRVLRAFEDSTWTNIELKTDNFELIISSDGYELNDAPNLKYSKAPKLSDSSDPNDESLATEVDETEFESNIAPKTGATAHSTDLSKYREIRSPTMGIFWRSPSPGSPPFVEVGHQVNEESTLCIVEVMKLMNYVKAGLDGEIVEICKENGQTVDKEDVLFIVAPTNVGIKQVRPL